MKTPTIVFIGSTVVDILMRVPHLPKQQEDINIYSQTYSLGGCAFNASWFCHLSQIDYTLFSPVGTGMYGTYVEKQMAHYGLKPSFLHSDEENGSCICLIDDSGERSFLCYHGAEYHFKKEWFALLDQKQVDMVYICGLEIEEESGYAIIDYIERHPHMDVYFACGPRIQHIQKDKMKRLFACSPILHVNQEEALSFTQCSDITSAAEALYARTHNVVIITLGKDGCAYYDGSLHYCATQTVKQVDTTGAGDCHIGAVIAYRSRGDSWREAIQKANFYAAGVVAKQGALLTLEEYKKIKQKC